MVCMLSVCPCIKQIHHTLFVCTADCTTYDFEMVEALTPSPLIYLKFPLLTFFLLSRIMFMYLQCQGILVYAFFTRIKLTCNNSCLPAGIKWRMWPELVQGRAEWQRWLHPQELHRNESTPVSTTRTSVPISSIPPPALEIHSTLCHFMSLAGSEYVQWVHCKDEVVWNLLECLLMALASITLGVNIDGPNRAKAQLCVMSCLSELPSILKMS